MKDRGIVEVEDKTFAWKVEEGMMTVSHPLFGSKTAVVGRLPYEELAKRLARELISDHRPK